MRKTLGRIAGIWRPRLRRKRLGGFVVHYTNGEELEAIYNQIFVRHYYRFSARHDAPVILDAGSHIGLSVLYFKSLYPGARITAFEPNPASCALLRLNVAENDLKDVTVVNAAVAARPGPALLHATISNDLNGWAWGDSLIPQMWGMRTRQLPVRGVLLSDWLDRDVDLIKVNIEGMEQAVLEEISPRVSRAGELMVEFHASRNGLAYNRIGPIVTLLEANGFALEPSGADLGARRFDWGAGASVEVLIRARRMIAA